MHVPPVELAHGIPRLSREFRRRESRLWMYPSGLLVPTFPPRSSRSNIFLFTERRVQFPASSVWKTARGTILVVISGRARGEKLSPAKEPMNNKTGAASFDFVQLRSRNVA